VLGEYPLEKPNTMNPGPELNIFTTAARIRSTYTKEKNI